MLSSRLLPDAVLTPRRARLAAEKAGRVPERGDGWCNPQTDCTDSQQRCSPRRRQMSEKELRRSLALRGHVWPMSKTNLGPLSSQYLQSPGRGLSQSLSQSSRLVDSMLVSPRKTEATSAIAAKTTEIRRSLSLRLKQKSSKDLFGK